MGHGSSVSIKRVGLTIGKNEIMAGIDLDIRAGEFICLLGPSGCGKSTLLNAIAGFQDVAGEISVAGKRVKGPGLDRGVVFQSSEALFPWLSVRENVRFGLRMAGDQPKSRQKELAQAALERVQMGHLGDRMPPQLSGGQQQRVALVRAMLRNRPILLLDESFSALDWSTRTGCFDALVDIARARSLAVVIVSHDERDAEYLGCQVLRLHPLQSD